MALLYLTPEHFGLCCTYCTLKTILGPLLKLHWWWTPAAIACCWTRDSFQTLYYASLQKLSLSKDDTINGHPTEIWWQRELR